MSIVRDTIIRSIQDILRLTERNKLFLPVALYALLTVSILWTLLSPGYIFTLDMVGVRNLKVNDELYGVLPTTAMLPVDFFIKLASYLMPSWMPQKLFLFAALFLAGLGAHMLTPSKLSGKFFSGIFYMLNPFVFVRFMAGHWGILLAFALLPFTVLTAINLFKEPRFSKAVAYAALLTLSGMFSVQFLVFALILMLILLLIGIRFGLISWRNLKWLLLSGTLFLGLNVYWIFNIFNNPLVSQITVYDLDLYTAKTWGTGTNVFFTLVSMHGFWRPPEGYRYITEILPGWQLLVVFWIFLAVYGFVKIRRTLHLPLAIPITIAGVAGLLFATGISSPYTSALFRLLFENIFFFKAFREPQVFVALEVLMFAFLGGIAVSSLQENLANRRLMRKIMLYSIIAILLLSPALYSLNMFGGFNGAVRSKDFPPEWYEANDYLNQDKGNFNVLFLPWHQYMTFTWSDRRILNPAYNFFDHNIIISRNVEAGQISSQTNDPFQKYITHISGSGEKADNFGALLIPLNVKYVILAKEADYSSYAFLSSQHDLKVVFNQSSIVIFRNMHIVSEVYRYESGVYQLASYTKEGPVSYTVHSEKPANSTIVLARPYASGWYLQGHPSLSFLNVSNAFPLSSASSTDMRLYFSPSADQSVKNLLAVLFAIVIAIFGLVVVSKRNTTTFHKLSTFR